MNKCNALCHANGDEKEPALTAGIKLDIPSRTWLYLGLAITVPAIIIILTLTLRDVIKK